MQGSDMYINKTGFGLLITLLLWLSREASKEAIFINENEIASELS